METGVMASSPPKVDGGKPSATVIDSKEKSSLNTLGFERRNDDDRDGADEFFWGLGRSAIFGHSHPMRSPRRPAGAGCMYNCNRSDCHGCHLVTVIFSRGRGECRGRGLASTTRVEERKPRGVRRQAKLNPLHFPVSDGGGRAVSED